ncbi:hypothetical protein O6H91_09G057000 [Diphasiastrum complanatum]|uniref:Uncharacterized protein n=2 Tax=Diphasiastrum complanatum TaxID=34168 RepID=A0ACC2CPP7_DIPCM|nr:hypothetical protein O6H91_09G019300 [Diphasiastrum complanatum]KAJ7543875.1 hypothetical protein O6H91_09G057000 [Diphasiastrum complanatum]
MFSLRVHALEQPQIKLPESMPSSATAAAVDVPKSSSQEPDPDDEDDDHEKASAPGEHLNSQKTVRFSSGNPRVEAMRGIMHLFRNTSVKPGSIDNLPVGRNENLCVLAVPSHMTGADFCQFTGSFIQNIKEIRIVRNEGASDRYSVLMKFDEQVLADDFYKHYDGKPFSSLEAEICHILFIADVQYTDSGEQASTPPCGLTELPTCPVCLERLDEHISGVLTTVCNHSFHSSCISKWTDSSCPVCRYCQQKSEKSTCSVCATSENLWICVICGFVGCGRYQQGHAIKHWKDTQHCYSLELESQRVWDYVGDNYVHRLIQSKTDGKLVALNGPCNDGSDDCSSCECSRGNELEEAVFESKLEAIEYEYNHLLSSQLENQRQYYEGLLAEAKEKRESVISQAVEKAVSLKLQKMHAKLEKDNQFLMQVNENLQANQELWKSKIQELEAREKASVREKDALISDLEEQVRDFMIYIEAQKTIENSTDLADVRDGTVLALPPSSNKSKPSRASKAGRKKH